MIDVIQWRASIGLWNCCQCTAGPTRHSIRTESSGRKKRKTGSLSLSPLIALLLFLLILVTGYLEYNPPSTGMNNYIKEFLASSVAELSVHVMLKPYSAKFIEDLQILQNFYSVTEISFVK